MLNRIFTGHGAGLTAICGSRVQSRTEVRAGAFAPFGGSARRRFRPLPPCGWIPPGYGRNRDLGGHVVWRRNVDEIDVGPHDQPVPIELRGLIAPLLGKGFEVGFVATADSPEDRPAIEIACTSF